jgi:hypothetical protein
MPMWSVECTGACSATGEQGISEDRRGRATMYLRYRSWTGFLLSWCEPLAGWARIQRDSRWLKVGGFRAGCQVANFGL